ncbi:hypothetical protein Hanom_Chr05g00434921 [Helianthus anomalus]
MRYSFVQTIMACPIRKYIYFPCSLYVTSTHIITYKRTWLSTSGTTLKTNPTTWKTKTSSLF